MKKLLLAILTVAVLSCLFAICISATTINSETVITLYGDLKDTNGSTVTEVKLYDSEGDALIWYLNVEGKLVSDKIANLISVDENGVISFTDQKIFYGSHSAKACIAVNLRDNVKVSGTDINFDGQIKHFDASKGEDTDTGFAPTGFQFGTYSFSGSTIQYFYFPKSAESTVKRMFQGTPVRVVDIDAGTPIKKLGLLTFYGASKLTEIFIPNDIEVITSLPDQGMFQNCTSLSRVEFEQNSTLWDAGHCTFYYCSSLKELYLPNSVKTVGHQFARASGLEVVSLGASFEYFTMKYDGKDPDQNHMWVFWGCSKLKTVYMPASFALISDTYNYDDLTANDERLDTFDRIFNESGSFTLCFTGTEEEIYKLKARAACTTENNSLINSLKTIYSYEEYIEAGSPSGSLAVYGFNPCDTFYNGEHKSTSNYVFTSFVQDCYIVDTCLVCNKEEIKKVLSPMFTFLGYSSNGEDMCVGYLINQQSIKEYEENNEKVKISYGFAVAAGNSNPIDKNGVAAQKAIGIDLTDKGYCAVDFVLTGDFSNPTYADAEISMNLYVIDNTSVGYIYGYNTDSGIVSAIYDTADNISFSDLRSKF